MAQKPSIPKGTRDFNPEQVAKRQYIFNTIRSAFETFGFQPIETPSFESSNTLMGKYGEEGDRLIFKILNSGEFLKSVDERFYTNISLIKELIHKGYSKLKQHLENDKILTSLYFADEEAFVSKIANFEIFDNKDYKLFGFRKDYILLKVSKVFYDTNLGENLQLANRYVSSLIKEISINYLKKVSSKITPQISEKALRYDLTVPFARYVVQHQNEIEFPFKRYQIQPVWRADRPQKGRFREFFQCDADVVGSKSLWQEVDFIQLYDTVFTALKLEGITIKINNRKILSSIADIIGAEEKLIDFTVALDKLDKIGRKGVLEELERKEFSGEQISFLAQFIDLKHQYNSPLNKVDEILKNSAIGREGVNDLRKIFKYTEELGLNSNLEFDATLARGLNYYTGTIFEVAAPKSVKMSSIGGGGRYDDLTGIFGMKDISGIGISFGLDRIYLVLEELNLFPQTVNKNVDVLFINFGDKEALFSLKAVKELRSQRINAELYPDVVKMKKQMNHANKRSIPFVVLIGEQEINSNTYTLKNMFSGKQLKVSLQELIAQIKEFLS